MAATYTAEVSVGSLDLADHGRRTLDLVTQVGAHVQQAGWDAVWKIEMSRATSGATASNETLASPDELTARFVGGHTETLTALNAVVSHDGRRHADAPMVAVDLRPAPGRKGVETTCWIRTRSDAEARGLVEMARTRLQPSDVPDGMTADHRDSDVPAGPADRPSHPATADPASPSTLRRFADHWLLRHPIVVTVLGGVILALLVGGLSLGT